MAVAYWLYIIMGTYMQLNRWVDGWYWVILDRLCARTAINIMLPPIQLQLEQVGKRERTFLNFSDWPRLDDGGTRVEYRLGTYNIILYARASSIASDK